MRPRYPCRRLLKVHFEVLSGKCIERFSKVRAFLVEFLSQSKNHLSLVAKGRYAVRPSVIRRSSSPNHLVYGAVRLLVLQDRLDTGAERSGSNR